MEIKNSNGDTALTAAAALGYADIVLLLLKAGQYKLENKRILIIATTFMIDAFRPLVSIPFW